MKFHPQRRIPFNDTARKRSYVLIRQRKEREALPLFSDAIAETQPSVDDTMADRARRWSIAEAEHRASRARDWIMIRRALKLLPDYERHAFLRYYYRVQYPLNGGYMRTVLHMFLDGRLVMHNGEIESQHHLDWLANRSRRIRDKTDEELLRSIQSPYALPDYLDELRAERQRRASL